MPNIFNDGGTLTFSGMRTCPKSTVKAVDEKRDLINVNVTNMVDWNSPSHQTPKWPISKTVSSPGRVKTIVFLSYRRSGVSLPFSSEILIPLGDGFWPRPTQNFASEKVKAIKLKKRSTTAKISEHEWSWKSLMTLGSEWKKSNKYFVKNRKSFS